VLAWGEARVAVLVARAAVTLQKGRSSTPRQKFECLYPVHSNLRKVYPPFTVVHLFLDFSELELEVFVSLGAGETNFDAGLAMCAVVKPA
jgi:hypothetical protein